MFSIEKKHFRNILLLIFGVIGAGWFFYQYPKLHPLSTVKIEYSKEDIISKADSAFQSWQYQLPDYLKRTEMTSADRVLDSLQKKLSRAEFQEKQKNFNALKPMLFNWKIRGFNKDKLNERLLQFGISTLGEVVYFDVADDLIKERRPFNRLALRHVFGDQISDYSRGFEDSLITGLVDYQHMSSGNESGPATLRANGQIRDLIGMQPDEKYIEDNIWKFTQYYLKRTMWKDFELQRDSVELMNESGIRFSRAYLSHTDSVLNINVNLQVDILMAGSLKSLMLDVEPKVVRDGFASEVIKTISFFIVLLFGLWLLTIFYLRIKAKAIDTKPAMIIAVVAGFIVPGFMLLRFLQELGLLSASLGTSEIINSLMVMGIFGALSAAVFFILTSVSDSITRQYWPEKLKTWDLIRRGIFNNKPMGWVVIQALSIGGILIGIWIIVVSLLPSVYITSTLDLASDSYALPSLANLLISIFITLLLVVTIYMILANQVVGMSGKKWLVPIISAVIFAILDVLPVNLNPWYLEVFSNLVTGFVLGWFYLKFDFLAIALGFFIFVNLLNSAEGWLISNSPDANVFNLFAFLLSGLTVIALYLITKGTEQEKLPDYVPSYIEDQTKEQRLKQELSIARVVQETFLPSQIHHLPGIDIAGTCIPAQETGGDYYDMISLGEYRTAIAIGDVSGKGIRAAFYMTFTKGILHSLSAIILSPVELLNQLNRLFNENATRGTFISMIYGILEADKRQFTFARAGHNPMLVVRKDGETEWLQPKGVGIGVTKDDSFIKRTEESILKLKEGDVVILYTDGITEMLNSGNRFYGEQRLERLVKGVRKASSAKILEIIINDVNEFKGLEKQHDDMTLVIIKADASVNQ